jgi:site-specific recombinase XerD
VATCFLDFIHARGRSIEAVTGVDVDDFIAEQGAFYQKATIANVSYLLRSFLRFLSSCGVVDADCSSAISHPRVFDGRRDPRYLKADEVQQVLSAVDRSTLEGKRNYAILVLLGLYGLRAGELSRLTLEDIRWRSMVMRVPHRKCDDALELPLLPVAAAALSEYLQAWGERRPREIFLSSWKPYGPLKACAVSALARKAILRAGVRVSHPGSHSFRYAAAQALFHEERPIVEIAEILGHRDLRSTLGYLSFVVHPLREVALNDGEEMA